VHHLSKGTVDLRLEHSPGNLRGGCEAEGDAAGGGKMQRLRESPGWMTDFAAHLAHQVQRARARAELLSLRTVAERLDAWQALLHGHGFPARGRWNEVAQEIGVSPEALYRELARRRETGALLGSGKRSN
jgi:CRP-like cAMP-binding protein